METKQIMSEKASEANSAQTHRETMNALLDSLQTENESLLDVTLTITAYNYLGDGNYKKSVRRAVMTGNFKPFNLYGLQIEGFKSSVISPISKLKNYERGINRSSPIYVRIAETFALCLFSFILCVTTIPDGKRNRRVFFCEYQYCLPPGKTNA